MSITITCGSAKFQSDFRDVGVVKCGKVNFSTEYYIVQLNGVPARRTLSGSSHCCGSCCGDCRGGDLRLIRHIRRIGGTVDLHHYGVTVMAVGGKIRPDLMYSDPDALGGGCSRRGSGSRCGGN